MGIAPVFLPVREMGGLLRRRQASPVELAELFIDRLETLGPRYNSVVTVTRDRALAEARAAEKEIASGCYRGAAPRRPLRCQGPAGDRRRHPDHLGRRPAP